MENLKIHVQDIFLSFIFPILFGCFSVFLLSIISYIFNFPQKGIDICIYIIMLLIFFSSGFIISSKKKSRGLLWGFGISTILILLFLIIQLLFFPKEFNIIDTLKRIPLLVLLGSLGGIFGVNIKLSFGRKGKKRRFSSHKK